MKGIDISNWQAGITPSNLDIDFCICKATEGTDFTDVHCDTFVQNCINNNILWGCYHYASYETPENEADYFYRECSNYFEHGIPVLDYEEWRGNDVAWCERFLTRLHDLSGVWAMVYISASHCSDFEGSWIPQTCGLWIAGYPYAYSFWIDEDSGIPYSIYPWEFAAIWQFTSTLNIPGYDGNLDGDIAYMDANAWMKYANSSDDHSEPEPDTHSKSCEELAHEVINGMWGNGWNRQQALDSTYGEGTYEHVQSIVNRILEG